MNTRCVQLSEDNLCAPSSLARLYPKGCALVCMRRGHVFNDREEAVFIWRNSKTENLTMSCSRFDKRAGAYVISRNSLQSCASNYLHFYH